MACQHWTLNEINASILITKCEKNRTKTIFYQNNFVKNFRVHDISLHSQTLFICIQIQIRDGYKILNKSEKLIYENKLQSNKSEVKLKLKLIKYVSKIKKLKNSSILNFVHKIFDTQILNMLNKFCFINYKFLSLFCKNLQIKRIANQPQNF